ncbi:MAG: indole-3-glycerol phosphate synthase TrpC [Chloroflexota bacterium]|nr:indole-3-glycerol phosphate synthase TrpC [Chloroflexota bacterium]
MARFNSFLDHILADKRRELERRLQEEPLGVLRRRARQAPPTKSLARALRAPSLRLIAEVKRASPSRGILRADLDPAALASIYARSGAAAISVLTEEQHFRGSLADLTAVRAALDSLPARRQGQGDARPPLLRKDFLFDMYHLFEARAYGADAVLLIAAILNPGLLTAFIDLARSLGLECLVEVHDEPELERALAAGAQIIGVNNRDLHTFQTDLAVTERLRPLIPDDRLVVAESGIHTRADVERLRRLGVHAVLIGEALVTADDPGARIVELFA